MKLTDYSISLWDSPKLTRHILLNKKALCNSKVHSDLRDDLDIESYFLEKRSLCSICIGKLPKGVGEKIKFNYIVRKLKNDI